MVYFFSSSISLAKMPSAFLKAGRSVQRAMYAFIVGLASIHWLMKWLANHSTFIFIYYRIALGLLLIGLLSGGVIQATK